jgi:Cu2+-exporting ATPase
MNSGSHERHHHKTEKHAGHKTGDFLIKFLVVLVLTAPILAYSELFEIIFGFRLPDFSGRAVLMIVLGSVVYFYGGGVFVRGAYRELRARLPGMMTLITLAITAAYIFSLFQILRAEPHNLLWELSTLIAVMLFGHWLEMKAVKGAEGALSELVKLLPDTAEVLRGGEVSRIKLEELRLGDVIIVRPGGKVPADGVIIEGTSEIDESVVTGETRPSEKTTGDEVIAGTTNGDGALKVRVSKIGEETFLAGVMRLVAEAQASKSRLQILSDRAALYLTAVAVLTGTITFIVWSLSSAGIVFGVERLVAVLVVACPHALGLAVPLVASISTRMAAGNGFLVRERLALEAAKDVEIVLFDKTGTLTTGEFGVDATLAAEGAQESAVLKLAASVDSMSEHPIAKAITREAKKRGLKPEPIKEFARLPGLGARGLLNGREILIGSGALIPKKGISLTPQYEAATKEFSRQGKTIIHVIDSGKLIGGIALSDQIRDESRQAIRALKQLGVKVAMVTGDAEDVAARVAGELGIDQFFARVLPAEKAEKVRMLQEKGMKVAMVGDGVNDAPALTRSDLGIAIGAGTNVAIESAGIILVKNDPRDIPRIIRLSKLTYAKMVENLFWATGYNIVALPLAAGALAARGIVLEPALAAVFMSLSTVIVALNALRLRHARL